MTNVSERNAIKHVKLQMYLRSYCSLAELIEMYGSQNAESCTTWKPKLNEKKANIGQELQRYLRCGRILELSEVKSARIVAASSSNN